MYTIKLLDPTATLSADQLFLVHNSQIKVGRNEECEIQYSSKRREVSRIHALLTYSKGKVTITKPYDFNNDILIDNIELKENYKILNDNSEVRFSMNGPKILVPFVELNKKPPKQPPKLDIPLIASMFVLFISFILFIVTYIKFQ